MIFSKQNLNQLYRYCLSLTKDKDDAYDLLQDSVERAIKHQGGTSAAFLRTIARNRFIDLCKRKNKQLFEVVSSYEDIDSVESDLESMVIDENCLQSIWSELNTTEREVVFLWAVEALSASQIARELDIPRATVLSRLRRLRIKAAEKMQQHRGTAI